LSREVRHGSGLKKKLEEERMSQKNVLVDAIMQWKSFKDINIATMNGVDKILPGNVRDVDTISGLTAWFAKEDADQQFATLVLTTVSHSGDGVRFHQLLFAFALTSSCSPSAGQ
jgi:hypothetical protein